MDVDATVEKIFVKAGHLQDELPAERPAGGVDKRTKERRFAPFQRNGFTARVRQPAALPTVTSVAFQGCFEIAM